MTYPLTHGVVMEPECGLGVVDQRVDERGRIKLERLNRYSRSKELGNDTEAGMIQYVVGFLFCFSILKLL